MRACISWKLYYSTICGHHLSYKKCLKVYNKAFDRWLNSNNKWSCLNLKKRKAPSSGLRYAQIVHQPPFFCYFDFKRLLPLTISSKCFPQQLDKSKQAMQWYDHFSSHIDPNCDFKKNNFTSRNEHRFIRCLGAVTRPNNYGPFMPLVMASIGGMCAVQ
jgi:hypothetical protein